MVDPDANESIIDTSRTLNALQAVHLMMAVKFGIDLGVLDLVTTTFCWKRLIRIKNKNIEGKSPHL